MISRPTLIGALVVVELAILGLAANAVGIGGAMAPPSFMFGAPPAPASQASTALDRTFLTGASPRVTVDVGDLDVTVEVAASPTVHVIETLATHGFTSGRAASLLAQQTPDGIRISATGEDTLHVIGSITHALRVVVPAGSRVQLAGAGAINASGLRGTLIAHTSDGSVHVHDHEGDVDVSTDDGRIEFVDVHGTAIDATTHDGRIYLTRVGADRLDAHSDSGRIVGNGVRAVDGALTTLDGRILVSFTASSNATTSVHTDDGDISVAGFPSLDAGNSRRTVTLGAGRGHFEVSTGDGPITITQGANG